MLDQRPSLRKGCRLSPPEAAESVLLIPEGALRLQGPGRRILELCDGSRTTSDIIRQLQTEFPNADPPKISAEVTQYLERLRDRGAVELT
jgi:pyrroloquinoline quinone biosynthesis protein D